MDENNNTLVNDDMIGFIKRHEGTIRHMYLDTRGNVTVGRGFILPDVESAKKIKFRDIRSVNKMGGYLSEKEIEKAYNLVRKAKFGQSIGAIDFDPNGAGKDKFFPAGLDSAYIDKKTEALLKTSERELRTKIPNFDRLPYSARKGLMDMQYNMGENKFNSKKWPKLFQALDKKDYKSMAKESHRADISEVRNQDIYDLFLSADAK